MSRFGERVFFLAVFAYFVAIVAIGSCTAEQRQLVRGATDAAERLCPDAGGARDCLDDLRGRSHADVADSGADSDASDGATKEGGER